MNCLLCHDEFLEKSNWQFVFGLTNPSLICDLCSAKFEKVEGELCKKCGRPFSLVEPSYRRGDLCRDCTRWVDQEGALEKNRSLYVYNEFLQEIIAKWKYRGDAEIVKLFWQPLQELSRSFQVDAVVPIPLNHQRYYERSFNQAEALAEGLAHQIVRALVRTDEASKQSKKNREDRLQQEGKFIIDLSHVPQIHSKSILIVDDIYTTGATVYAAAKILIENGAAQVNSVTIARG